MNFSGENLKSGDKPDSASEKMDTLFMAFKKEIQALKSEEEEMAEKKKQGTLKLNEGGTYNLIGINLDELVQEDMDMWETIKHYRPTGGQVMLLIFEDYRSRIIATGNRHRIDFAGFLANKLTPIITREYIDSIGGK